MTDLDYSAVAASAEKDALHLFDLLLREVLTSDLSVQGSDPEAIVRVEAIFTHMRDGTCPPSQGDILRARMAGEKPGR